MSTVLVTGAAGGIGKATCEVFAAAGYKVIAVDRNEMNDTNFSFIQFDISQLGSGDANCASFIHQVEEFAKGGLEVLINNAAVQIVKPFEQITAADWRETLDTNLLAPFWLIQRLLPLLRAAHGSVVNVASIHSTQTKQGFGVYATSKGALVAMTRAIAIELAPIVRVNAIIPAATDTPMLRAGFDGNLDGLRVLGEYHPLGRIAAPEEVARVMLFLASSQASFMTGAAVNVDGGIGACLHDPVFAR